MKQTPSNDVGADVALWRRWLDWRYPHYDRMAQDAAKTLTGDATAVVRVGFDASTLSLSEWHVSLFTRTRQTPDPAATVAAAMEWKPIGMILHHVVTPSEFVHERAARDVRPDEIARAVAHARLASLPHEPRERTIVPPPHRLNGPRRDPSRWRAKRAASSSRRSSTGSWPVAAFSSSLR